ncbi:MAG: hypothetical protein ACRDZ3_19415 [Acidimicrobiia bacterium]
MSSPDGFQLLVPTAWKVLGAGAVPTSPNKDMAEGSLQSSPASVAELIAAGTEPAGTLFRAQGVSGTAETGVAVGIYDTGSPDSLKLLSQAVSQAAPSAEVKPIAIAETEGLRVMSPPGGSPVGTERIVSDYWVPVPRASGTVALVRFWRRGPGSSDDVAALHERMAGSFGFMFPAYWSGPNRPFALKMYAAPAPDAPAEEDGWRLAGWRLANVFHTAMLPAAKAAALSQAGARRVDRVMILAVFLAWLGALFGLVAFEGGPLLAGGMALMGSLGAARKYRWRAVVGLAVVLAAILGVALGIDSR